MTLQQKVHVVTYHLYSYPYCGDGEDFKNIVQGAEGRIEGVFTTLKAAKNFLKKQIQDTLDDAYDPEDENDAEYRKKYKEELEWCYSLETCKVREK